MATSPRISISPPPGVFRAATANAAAGRWFDANLMRWRGGQAIPVGGNVSFPGLQMESPGRDALTWHDNKGKRWAAIGTDTKLYAYDFVLGLLRDITPAGVGPLEPPGAALGFGLGDYGEEDYGTARDPSNVGPTDISANIGDGWNLDLFGEDLVFVPTQDGHLFRWKPATPDTPPAIVANAPIDNLGVFVTDERFVVLIGAGGIARKVQWCDRENPDVWIPTVSNQAGDLMLETEGRPLLGYRVTGGNLIHTDNDVHLFKYVGPPYAYGLNKIAANCGLVSRRASSWAGGVALWMGQQTFWRYDGSVTPVVGDISDWLFSLLNRSMIGRVFAAPNPAFTEHWFFFPSEDATECNRYVLFNYGEPKTPWSIGSMYRTASDTRGGMLRPLLCGLDGKFYMHEFGWTDDGVSRVGIVYLETGDVSLDSTTGRRFHVKQILPDYTGSAEGIGFRFFTWEEPGGPLQDTGVFPVSDTSGLTDARFSARGVRMRIEALADKPFALGNTRLLTRPGGSR